MSSKAASNEASKITLKPELENSYFCAICELIDAGDAAKPFVAKYPTLNFFRLRPVEIFWGSLNQAKPSLMIHPKPKREAKCLYLVVLRHEHDLVPGDWIKKYTPIQADAQKSSYYLLDGKKSVNEEKLREILKLHSKIMQKKHPLDKARVNAPAK
jgi:hypothetical protein